MKKNKSLLVCAIFALVSTAAFPGVERGRLHDFAAAIVPSVQTPDVSEDVALLRVSLVCGWHRNMYGLDFGVFGNITSDDMIGCGIAGLFNWVGESRSAFQFAGLIDFAGNNYKGMQMSLGANLVGQDMVGLQIGSVNIVDNLVGMQFGGFNKARTGSGFQLGGVNVSERFVGVQIGLLNLNLDSSVPLSPIFNCRF